MVDLYHLDQSGDDDVGRPYRLDGGEDGVSPVPHDGVALVEALQYVGEEAVEEGHHGGGAGDEEVFEGCEGRALHLTTQPGGSRGGGNET